MLNVQFIDRGRCPIADFDIYDDNAADVLKIAWALFEMTGIESSEVKQIVITRN